MKRPLSIIVALLIAVCTLAQTADNIRYVKTTGAYTNDGKSWATAKNNIQDAINELYKLIESGKITTGYVYVAKGTYIPTESTETGNDGSLYTSFKMYEGITVYGGFPEDIKDTDTNSDGKKIGPDDREIYLATNEDGDPVSTFTNKTTVGKYREDSIHRPQLWQMVNETILSGNHTSTTAEPLSWDSSKGTFIEAFTGNSYHVVWFATKGFFGDEDTNSDAYKKLRARWLDKPAVLDGFTIKGGYASNRTTTTRQHNSYGGGVYLVDNGIVRNCKIYQNAATLRGGGVYMDGGGTIDHCLVHTNQAAGIGVTQGYGGGVCVDFSGSVLHSVITNNSARMGGGLAVCHETKEYITEEEAGLVNEEIAETDNYYDPMAVGCVVNNNTATAEAGGIALIEGGTLNHLTIVRNKCVGSDVTIDGKRLGRTGGVYVDGGGVLFNSVLWGNQGADATDDESDVQYAVYTSSSTPNIAPYVYFTALTQNDITDWGSTHKTEVFNLESDNEHATNQGIYPMFESPATTAGVNLAMTSAVSWMPQAYTDLRTKGVKLRDYPVNDIDISPAGIDRDMYGSTLAPRCVLGALNPKNESFSFAMVTSVEDANEGKIPTIFVDPDRDEHVSIQKGDKIGESWDEPLSLVNNALSIFRILKSNNKTATPANDNTAITFDENTKCQILVKQGEDMPVGSYRETGLRASSLEMVCNVRLYGGYPSSLTGTTTTGRDPVKYPTRITGDVAGGNYKRNAFHLVIFNGVRYAILDGFQLYGGNTTYETDAHETASNKNGGGILVESNEKRHDSMNDNQVRNCIIANCTAEQGAGIMIEGKNTQLSLTNVIVHNNTSTASTKSAICVDGTGASLSLNHCTIRGNVGYAINNINGTVTMNNSLAHVNTSSALIVSSMNTYDNILCFKGTFDSDNSSNNMWDKGGQGSSGYSSIGSNTLDRSYGGTGYPTFINPTTNTGAQESLNDVTKYGGDADFTPTYPNPIINVASDASMTGTDMAGNIRNYGGAADIGALEDTKLPEYGKVIYVRDYGNTTDTGGDGSSWAKAINGNCTSYTSDHGFEGFDAELYEEDTFLTGLQWAVDEAYYRSIKNDDGTITYTSKSLNTGSTISVSTVNTEKKVEVWVAKGEYLRRTGFFMRDGVDVYGGFPSSGNPGKDERAPKTYETILETLTTAEHNTLAASPKYITVSTSSGANYTKVDKTKWTAIASSESLVGSGGDYNPASYAIDNSTSTFWHTDWQSSNPYPPHLYGINTGTTTEDISRIEIINRVAGSSNQAFTDYRVLTSNDDAAWTYLQNNITNLGGSNSNNTQNSVNTKLSSSITSLSSNGWTEQNISIINHSTSSDEAIYYLEFKKPQSFKYLLIIFVQPLQSLSGNRYACVREFNLYKKEKAEQTEEEVGIVQVGASNASVTYSYGFNSYGNAYISRRVLTQPYPYYNEYSGKEGISDTEGKNDQLNPFTQETVWNGFTIRNGITHIKTGIDGGAGVALRKNGVLENCEIKNNINLCSDAIWLRGGGVFCNGGTIKNCTISDNALISYGTSVNKANYGGGAYYRDGTLYNTVVADNEIYVVSGNNKNYGYSDEGGAGVYFENGKFYNNTFAGNHGYCTVGTNGWFGSGILYMYNCIFYGNINEGNYDCYYYKSSNFGSLNLSVLNNLSQYGYSKASDLTLSSSSNEWLTCTESPFEDGSYRLKKEATNAINKGLDLETYNIDVPEYDADYTARIKDCAIDIGAYEYDGAGDISTDYDTSATGHSKTFYVSQNGAGTRSGESAANAACYTKLQTILDAAGRYKYNCEKNGNTTAEIVVKLAGFDGYCPQRNSVDKDSIGNDEENPRTYSIMVPRGITVKGGYSDVAKDGYATFAEETRDVLKNPTILTGYFKQDNQDVHAYHTVTFVEHYYYTDGRTAHHNDSIIKKGTAVLDGLFITDGSAEGTDTLNRNGGAAIVPNYAHVRNCIIYGNEAVDYGGALYLKPGALVSGCIIMNNKAEDGGGIYVEEPKSGNESYARIYTSTIVGNTASRSGGGIHFETNLRANSTVIWRNTGSHQSNVAGTYDPYSTSAPDDQTAESYPLAFCAVENLRVAGVNNISVSSEESKGVRFDESKDTETAAYQNITDLKTSTDGNEEDDVVKAERFFYIKKSSVLGRAGMERDTWDALRTTYPTLEKYDLAGVNRTDKTYESNKYIEIGARAYKGKLMPDPNSNLMLRIFVAPTSRTDETLVSNMINQTEKEYYAQMGSSFANPLHRLDDALEYVREARKIKSDGLYTYRNKIFEIYVSGGEYYPLRSLTGSYDESRAKTYAVPEGVHIYGGLNPEILYCGKKDEAGNSVTEEEKVTFVNTTALANVTLLDTPTNDILDAREHADHNKNNLVEPWEFKETTQLSGGVVNSESANRSFHVISCMADENIMGGLPDNQDNNYSEATSSEKRSAAMGLRIVLDGLQISNGMAYQYDSATVASPYTYYKGGAISVDGNWTTGTTKGKNVFPTFHNQGGENGNIHAVGYRNIPLEVRYCNFTNNEAGMGGAIFTDSELTVHGCRFVQNRSKSSSDEQVYIKSLSSDGTIEKTPDWQKNIRGRGGAINCQDSVLIVNSLFANNETVHETGSDETYGGVLVAGDYARVTVLNCNVVRNKAAAGFPAFYFFQPNQKGCEKYNDNDIATQSPHKIINTIFWGNEVAEGKNNYVANYSTNNGYTMDDAPATLWFCAHEKGAWKDPKTAEIKGTRDFRKIPYTSGVYVPKLFYGYNDTLTVTTDKVAEPWTYNQNIILSSNNDDLDGPNFINPSQEAGYDGYTESTDWMMGRINNLVDNGWTFLGQTVQPDTTTFDKADLVDEEGKVIKKDDNTGDGIYLTLAREMNYKRTPNRTRMPYGDKAYMYYDEQDRNRMMLRISKDPNPTHKQSYIDIGVYEYQHVKLNVTEDGQVDYLWVCDHETMSSTDNDGKTWERATSDLQRAIETLLSSRNDHEKKIYLRSGTYQPVYTISGNTAFTINTVNLNTGATAPAAATAESSAQGVKSLTIQGGWSDDIKDTYDVEDYPANFYSTSRTGIGQDMQNYVFNVECAAQMLTWKKGTNDYVSLPASTGKAIPITLEGITFHNSKATATAESDYKGSAIRYNDQYKYEKKDNVISKTTDLLDAPDNGAKKLTLKRCIVAASGDSATAATSLLSPAVYIGKGGGEALIYNSLFHSNYGDAMNAYGTKVVNCTFALNGGNVKLYKDKDGNYTSSIYNSLLWRDNLLTSNSSNEELDLTDGESQYNAIYNKGTKDDDNHNAVLNENNSAIADGPNFTDPKLDATSDDERMARDFHILPSLITVTQASPLIYYNKVNDKNETTLTDAITKAVTADTDLAGEARLYGAGLERGAYECITKMRQVLYVDPYRTVDNADGWTWQNAYNGSKIQDAIDAAAVAVASTTDQWGYVYVKGDSKNATLGKSITLRNKVNVICGIATDYTNQAATDDYDNLVTTDLEPFMQTVLAERAGTASPFSNKTIVTGVNTDNVNISDGALLDGLYIKGNTTATKPVLNIVGEQQVTIRNCIITGNKVTGNPIANVQQGLLYNVLFCDNTTDKGQPQVKLGENAYMLNCTVANASGQKETENSGTGNIFNHIEVNDTKPFAPYFNSSTIYGSYKELSCQLHEESSFIDKGSENYSSISEELRKNVNFDTDRDLLGNPRLLNDAIDYGCYETWNASSGVTLKAMKADEAYNNGIVAAYNWYPHAGSVVYIHNGGNLVLDDNNGNLWFPDKENSFSPGFVLVEQGGSLYGQGNHIYLNYVAVEKPISSQYSLVALPFTFTASGNISYKTVTNKTDSDSDNTLTLTTNDNALPYLYDSEGRAESDYAFAATNSTLWKEPDDKTTPLAANQGWLMSLTAAPDEETTYRFTSCNSKDYVYTEIGAKSVTLNQFDNCTPSTSETSGYNFTNEYNMGWNLKGLPYLVSDYATGDESETVTTYPMNIPHVVYTMKTDGNYETMQSWESGKTLSTGDGFFTQTATMDDAEKLSFKLPVYSSTKSRASETTTRSIAISNEGGEDVVTLNPVKENASLSYTLGSDGAKLMALNDTLPQIYVIGANDARMSLASKAPEEKDISLGFLAQRVGTYTVSSPKSSTSGEASEAEASSDVWLTDHYTGAVVNLSESDYTMTVDDEGEYLDRLTVRFGGTMPFTPRGDSDSNGYTISVNGSTVTISGLSAGDNVRIVTAAGALFDTFTARNSEETRQLHKGYYVVNINGFSKTILCR